MIITDPSATGDSETTFSVFTQPNARVPATVPAQRHSATTFAPNGDNIIIHQCKFKQCTQQKQTIGTNKQIKMLTIFKENMLP